MKATPTSLQFLQLSYYPVEGAANAEYLGPAPEDGSGDKSFDPVIWPRVTHGQTKRQTSFTVGGKPARPKPALIVFYASIEDVQHRRTINAVKGRFIASVDSTVGGEGDLTVIAYQDDGTPARVTDP